MTIQTKDDQCRAIMFRVRADVVLTDADSESVNPAQQSRGPIVLTAMGSDSVQNRHHQGKVTLLPALTSP
jgi:hypothetical protein